MVAGTVLVTGASGFVGLALVPQLRSAGYRVIAATRNPDKFEGLEAVRLPSPAEPAEAFAHIVANVDHVVHLAAIAHTQLAGAAATYHAVNCELAAKLARSCPQDHRRQVRLRLVHPGTMRKCSLRSCGRE